MLVSFATVGSGCGRSVHLGRAHAATSHPRDHFLPRGIRTLAEGRVPGGPGFAISAERYGFEGKIYTDLSAAMEPHAPLGGASGSFAPEPTVPFSWTTEQGCSKNPSVSWSIVYGLLRDPNDQVSLYTGRARHVLRTASIPAFFRLHGKLGYAALSQVPSRVLVRNSSGKLAQEDDLGPSGEHCTPGESSSLMVLRSRGSLHSE